MALSISGNKSNIVYGKGDVCLKLNPYDNYRLFTLYEDWREDDRKPIDLSNGQNLYLIFKSNNKEIRIPEYTSYDSNYNVDKVNGQVLFKISAKNAVDILDMDDHTFYITRVYNITDYAGDQTMASDEEVLYTGKWKDEASNTTEGYSAKLKELLDLLEERNKQIRDLMTANAELVSQNVDLATQLADLKAENAALNARVSELEAANSSYESGTEYTGTVLGGATHHTIISGRQYTEEEMDKIVSQLKEVYQE